MNSVITIGLFTRFKVESNALVAVSHLQFVGDTLLIGRKCWANDRTMREVLMLFEVMSGLKVNFHKSMLTRVNVTNAWLNEATLVRIVKLVFYPLLIYLSSYWWRS